MDVSSIAKAASTIADTGTKQEIDIAVQKKAQDIAVSTATQLIDAIKSPPPVQNLPDHLGQNINTTA
jgi:hypothetical protein